MTVQQALLKLVYPFLILLDKLMPAKDALLINSMQLKPVASIYAIQIVTNTNEATTLAQYKGKKILIVNTASNCGFTAQYGELEKLYQIYKETLVIVAFPSNDFRGQEPEDDKNIGAFCKLNYGISFPLMRKSVVIKSKNQNEIYQWLTDPTKNGWCSRQPNWNFCKYLINEEGMLTHFFKQTISPLDKRVIAAIEIKN